MVLILCDCGWHSRSVPGGEVCDELQDKYVDNNKITSC